MEGVCVRAALNVWKRLQCETLRDPPTEYESFSVPDVSSLLSSWKAERENDAFPLPCLEGVVLKEKGETGL